MKSLPKSLVTVAICFLELSLYPAAEAQNRALTVIEQRYVEIAKASEPQVILRAMERAQDPNLTPLLKMGLQLPEYGATYLQVITFLEERPGLAKKLISEIGITFHHIAGATAGGERNTLLMATANLLIKISASKEQAAAIFRGALKNENDPWVMEQVVELLGSKS
jgi:hypothetical protein